jgi:O-antigen ligase
MLRVLRSRSALLMGLFYVCMIISYPFSMWRGGSTESMIVAMRSLLLMSSIIALTVTTAWTLRLMYVIGLSMATAGVLSVAFGEQSDLGRLALAAGTLADPNIYAMSLLMGLPFVLMKAKNEENWFRKAIPLGAALPILYAAIQTGSRGGMLAMCVLFGVLFLRSSMEKRAMLLILGLVGVAAALIIFPDQVLGRYLTFFRAAQSGNVEDNEIAAASASARKYLFIRSIELTLRNPLVGVGPGMFSNAEGAEAKSQGYKGAWHETHNTYTQVSSEIGIPGMLLYVAALVIALRGVYRISKARGQPGNQNWLKVKNAAFYLHLGLITAMAGAFFLSIAYNGSLFILVGLAAALEQTATQEFGGGPRPAGAPVRVAPGRRPAAGLSA